MNFFLNNLFTFCDTPRAWGVYFQDSASPQMDILVELRDNIMFYLVIIFIGVGWILVTIIRNYLYGVKPVTNQVFNPDISRSIWTIIPAVIFFLILFPSLKIIYLMDEASDPSLAGAANDLNRDYCSPLDVPEASDEDEIPFDIIEPFANDPDRHLTLLRNEVRVAYIESHTISNMSRENPDAVPEEQVEEYEQTFYDRQKDLKRYLNEKYDGNFDVEDT